VRQYWAIREALSVYNGIALFGRRIIVPLSTRREVLGKLHAAHKGIVRMKRQARQTVYWPGISYEITFLVESCEPCQERRPHHQQEPLLRDPCLRRCSRTSPRTFSSSASFTFWCTLIAYRAGPLFIDGTMIRPPARFLRPSWSL
jgi:hypothetical protein